MANSVAYAEFRLFFKAVLGLNRLRGQIAFDVCDFFFLCNKQMKVRENAFMICAGSE